MSTMPETAAPSFMSSRTCRALASACLGEASARRLYLAAAQTMEDARLYVVAHALRFTAAQEKEHEAIFRGLLAAQGVTAPAPVEDTPPLPAAEAILHHIIRAETDEAEKLYPHNARIADQEGYPRIAAAFRRIGETEALHARRFQRYAQALADGSLFRDEQRLSWLCLACGELHAGVAAPDICSACGRDQGHFIRSSFYPFTLPG